MKEKYSVAIEFSKVAYREVLKMKDEMKVESEQDVIREALAYLRWSRQRIQNGEKLFIGIKGSEMEIRPVMADCLYKK